MSEKLKEMQNNGQLPKAWAKASIADICNLVNGRAFKPTEWSSEGLPIVRIQNLNNHEVPFNYCNFEVEEKFKVNRGQLLFAWSGTPGTSFGAHIWNRRKAVLNQHIFKMEIDERYINKIFLMHLINDNVADYIRQAHGTAGLAHITKGKFENSLIPIPPFNEQCRIADKIEELFTKLDAGAQSLQTTKKLLKRYRQSVLKAAVEGKLTKEWREAHQGKLEPASKLLERILKERREKWEVEHSKELKKNGKRPKDDSWKKKYKEPSSPEGENLLELPYKWAWAGVMKIRHFGKIFPRETPFHTITRLTILSEYFTIF